MATTTPGTSPGRAGNQSDDFSPFAVGLIVTAGVFLVLGGFLQALQGLGAIIDDEFYVVTDDYVYAFDATTWGWIHLVLGIVVLLAGIGLFQGATWARVVAVMVASVSIVASFLWAPYYPLWSLLLISFNIFAIWAVTAHGRDVRVTD